MLSSEYYTSVECFQIVEEYSNGISIVSEVRKHTWTDCKAKQTDLRPKLHMR